MPQPSHTPGKHPFIVPTQSLRDAIDAEWAAGKKFSTSNMPLTSLAYTAIDKIAGQEDHVVEALLAYVDTDALCYRAETQAVLERQKQEWDPVLAWAGKTFGASWNTTTGIMPLEQSKKMVDEVRAYLHSLDSMRLAAVCVLAPICSSLILAMAVLKEYVNAEKAFDLSRVEEDAQAEAWGRDAEAEARRAQMKAEISSVGRFLRLLETA